MQIRIANRQDEKKIVEFIEEIFSEHELKLDLASVDADLKNVEANYFGRDGAFLVAEHEQKIVGIAGANMIDESICALRRIYIAKDFRSKGIARGMLSIIVSIAKRLDYKKLLVCDTICDGTRPVDVLTRARAERFLNSLSFKVSTPAENRSLAASSYELLLS